MVKAVKKSKRTKRSKSIPFHKRKSIIAIGLIVFSLVGYLLVRSLFASSTLTFSLYSTHPYASKAGYTSSSVNYYTGAKLCTTATFCPTGQTLVDIGFSQSGELVAGYGDWDSNVDSFGVPEGRVGIVPLNVTTGQWGPITTVGSEALDVIREINGYVYAPTTDPSDILGSKSGYATNRSGSWAMVHDNTNAVHTLDIASYDGRDLLLFGSYEGGGARAVVWRSPTGSNVFSETLTDKTTSGAPTNFERYYWGALAGGKLYTKAFSTNPEAPTRSYDGNTWTAIKTNPCTSYLPRMVVSFAGKMVCPTLGSAVNVFDGNTVRTSAYSTLSGTVYDFYVKDSFLYVLSSSGIYRTNNDVQTWTYIGAVPAEARSIGVYNNYVYLGGLNGKIFRSDSPMDGSTGSPAPVPPAGISAINTTPREIVLDKGSVNVTVDGSNLRDVSVTLAGVRAERIYSSDTQVIVRADKTQILRKLKLKPGQSGTISVLLTSPTGAKATAPSINGIRP